MPTLILATKIYMPPQRLKVILRPNLIERLNEGLHRKLTIISAPAGFGKTKMHILVAVGRKLLSMLYAILKRGVRYDPNWEENSRLALAKR
jgi:hypothetical protein